MMFDNTGWLRMLLSKEFRLWLLVAKATDEIFDFFLVILSPCQLMLSVGEQHAKTPNNK